MKSDENTIQLSAMPDNRPSWGTHYKKQKNGSFHKIKINLHETICDQEKENHR